jgi:hypothetical protein
MKTKSAELSACEQRIVDTVRVRPVRSQAERARCLRLLQQHHYLGELQAVGEQVFYVAHGPNGGWRAVLVFCAVAKHLGPRDRWIGWTPEQRRRRLALVANNARYLVLPGFHVPNLATRVMRLTLDRLSADWSDVEPAGDRGPSLPVRRSARAERPGGIRRGSEPRATACVGHSAGPAHRPLSEPESTDVLSSTAEGAH